MNCREVESLRDLAIAHFPKAREQRAQAVQYGGKHFADSGLQSACTFEDPESTAVEKQARQLLQLTFLHPEAGPESPFSWDAVKDAELIADHARALEAAVEMQPQIEAAMLDAARLLCRLTGAALPPWVEAAPETAPPKPRTGRPSDLADKQRVALTIVKAFEEIIGPFVGGELPRTKGDFHDACRRLEKEKTGKTTRFGNVSPDTLAGWLRPAGYRFASGKPPGTAKPYTAALPRIAGRIHADVFAVIS